MITHMAKSYQENRARRQRGFSLAELMVAMVVLLVVIGGVFQLLSQSQQRYVSTANVEDSTAMAREAVDLMAREIRLAGYPKPNSFPAGVIDATHQQYIAAPGGILGVAAPATPDLPASPYTLRFEADIGTAPGCGGALLLMDYRCTGNTGVVTQIDYQLQVPTGGATGGCAGLAVNALLTSPTLMRSQLTKAANGNPQTPTATDYVPYVSNVVNCTLNQPIFTYCGPVAAAGGCPDLSGQPPGPMAAPQNTRVVLIRLMVQTQQRDPQTQNFQIVEFYSVADKVNREF